MYNNDNGSYKVGINWKDLIIKIVMFVLFILLLVKLFPKVNLDVFYDSVYNNNIKEMKEAARNYYTVDRLPVNVGDKSSMTLKEMFDNNYLIRFTDKNGDTCDERNSKVEVTKLSDKEYSLKVQLTCNDKNDYIIETIGCTSICTNGTCTTIIDNGNNSNIGTIIDNNNGNNNSSSTKPGDSNISGGKDDDFKVTYTLYQHRKPVPSTKITYTCPDNSYTLNDKKCTKVGDGATIDATPIYEADQVITTDAKLNSTGNYTVYADYIKTEIGTEYSCPEGFTKNGAYCIKYTDAKAGEEQKTCPTGYTLEDELCVKRYSASYIAGETKYTCNNGDSLNGTICTTSIAATPHTEYECPSGFTPNGSSCYKIYTATKRENTTCPSGYYDNGSNCKRTYSATNKPTCPSGFTQSGNSCVRTYDATPKLNCPSGYNPDGSKCISTYDATGTPVYGSWVNQGTKYYTSSSMSYTGNTSKLVLQGAVAGATCGSPCGNKGIWYSYTYYTRSVSTTYSCPRGDLNGSTCILTTTGTTTYSCPQGDRNGTICTVTKSLIDDYKCNYGDTLNGTTCTSIVSKINGAPTYTCDQGGNPNSNGTCTLTVSGTPKTYYTCPQGYTQNNTTCEKTYTANKNPSDGKYYCSDGDTLNGTTCISTVKPTIKVEENVCPTGYVYNNTSKKCEYTIDATATKQYSYTCPTGYTKTGEGENTICSLEKKGTETYYCEDAEATLVGNKCTKTVKGNINGYTCPDSSYTLNGTKCIKKNVVTIDAIENEKTTVSYKYKWSQSSSIEGWEFTGKTKTETKDYTAGQQ